MQAGIEAPAVPVFDTARTAVVRRAHCASRAPRACRIAPCARSGIPDTGSAG
ncbi:hypothetical protein [Streptomyces sp. NPDC101393]|uniref:hypothetical protein n=1 Tax=Streptomyces sp. NPDC101393 TaxID=3366141 RepID=UPI00381F5D6E